MVNRCERSIAAVRNLNGFDRIERLEQIVERRIFADREGSTKARTEHIEVPLGQQADRDDLVRAAGGGGADAGSLRRPPQGRACDYDVRPTGHGTKSCCPAPRHRGKGSHIHDAVHCPNFHHEASTRHSSCLFHAFSTVATGYPVVAANARFRTPRPSLSAHPLLRRPRQPDLSPARPLAAACCRVPLGVPGSTKKGRP